MQMTQQADLAQRLLENDELALDEILRTFGPCMLRVLGQRYQSVLRETDIEDVMSIGLFRLWTNRQRFDSGKASLKVWFFRIVENAARDVLKYGWHKARQLEVEGDVALLGVPENDHGNVDSIDVSPTNAQLHLREIVADLPQGQRFIVLADAAANDGVASSQLLADELGVSASSVRVYRKRAMDRIKTELEKRGHDVPGHD